MFLSNVIQKRKNITRASASEIAVLAIHSFLMCFEFVAALIR